MNDVPVAASITSSRLRASLVLAALTGVLVLGLISQPDPRNVNDAPLSAGAGDIALHAATIARIQGGEAYYAAYGREMRERGYPTASVFNWRTPLLFVALATYPRAMHVAFVALGIGVLFGTVVILLPRSEAHVAIGAGAQAGAAAVVLAPGLVVIHEAWAGCLVALAVLAYIRRWWIAGALLTLAALFVRELVAPFAVFAAVLSFHAGRRREAAVWIAGALVYAAYFWFHVSGALASRQPTDLAQPVSWFEHGGVQLLLASLRTNGLLNAGPRWLSAVVLVAIIASAFRTDVAPHARGAVAVYLLFFAAVGHPFNWYWGWIPGQVYPLVLADGVMAAWVLLRVATARAPQTRRPRSKIRPQ